jgi:hypothetical protein
MTKPKPDDDLVAILKDLHKPATRPAPPTPAASIPSSPAPRKRKAKAKQPAPPAPPASPEDPDDTKDLDLDKIDEKHLQTLQNSLVKLSKKAIKRLNKLMNSDNDRVKMQAALGALRATVQALVKDTSSGGGGAEIHIHTSANAAVVSTQPPGQEQAGPQPGQMQAPQRTGHPIAIVK